MPGRLRSNFNAIYTLWAAAWAGVGLQATSALDLASNADAAGSQEMTVERDLAFMRTPEEWPRWPLLPLVSRTAQMDDETYCAVLVGDGRPRIFYAVLGMPAPSDQLKWREYASFEDLVADYRVD